MKWKDENLLELRLNCTKKEIYVTDLELSLDYYSTIFNLSQKDPGFINQQERFGFNLKQAKNLNEVDPKKLLPEVYGDVNSLDELYELYLTLKENGALFAYNPRDTYSNGVRIKEFAIRDIDGYIIAFKTNLKQEKEHSLES